MSTGGGGTGKKLCMSKLSQVRQIFGRRDVPFNLVSILCQAQVLCVDPLHSHFLRSLALPIVHCKTVCIQNMERNWFVVLEG